MFRSLVLLMTLTAPAYAAPVLNANAPGATTITAFPDNVDKNLYYVAPTVMTLAHDEHGVPLFSYMEEQHAFTRKAVVQTTMVPSYNKTEYDAAIAQIKAANPNAKFTALPFVDSQVKFGDVLSAFVEKDNCNHTAGLVGDEESCSFRLTSKGRHVMRSSFADHVTLTFQLQYSIDGVIENPDHTYTAKRNTYEMAGRLGGEELAKYPQLFRDPDGKVIGVVGDEDNSIAIDQIDQY